MTMNSTAWLFATAAILCLWLRYRLASQKVDATSLLVALGPVNAATFSMRNALAWTRGTVTPKHEPKKGLFAFASENPHAVEELVWREGELRARYTLAPLHAASTAHIYRENLYVLDLLDRHANDVRPSGRARALDVGSQDFRYAFGLSRWLGPKTSLTGIEIDGHRIYSDLHSRKDHAEAFVAQIAKDPRGGTVRYEVADFLEHQEEGKVDVITFFFPFVLEYALLRWGLPRRCFLPNRIFEHARTLLKPGGIAIVMNHTEAERLRQLELLVACGYEIIRSGPVTSELVDYAADVPERSLTIARRPNG